MTLFHLCLLLGDLNSYVRDFGAALDLFDMCIARAMALEKGGLPEHSLRKEKDKTRRWKFMAARDGAMTVFHFGKTLQAINDQVFPCGPILSLINENALRQAAKQFGKDHPRFEAVRHSIAHLAEFKANAAIMQEHAEGHIFLQERLDGRKFQFTFEGKIVEYELDYATIQKLEEVKLLAFSAFEAIDSNKMINNPFFPSPDYRFV